MHCRTASDVDVISTLVPLWWLIVISSMTKRVPGDEHLKIIGKVDEITANTTDRTNCLSAYGQRTVAWSCYSFSDKTSIFLAPEVPSKGGEKRSRDWIARAF